jgi:hypothetical protein
MSALVGDKRERPSLQSPVVVEVAPCSGRSDLFFGEGRENESMRAAREAEARALCTGCPRRQACFNGALEREEEWGIWGGHPFPYDPVAEAQREARRTERTMGAAVARAVVTGRDSAGITRRRRGARDRQEALAS